MEFFPDLKARYTKERLTAREAQRMAEFIAWGPVVFQTARVMLEWGILALLRESDNGMTREEICKETGRSDYAVKCLTEASLCIGLLLVDEATGRFSLSKTGWFLLNDPATRVNVDFNHYVNYEGWFKLEESLANGKPEGLAHFGSWSTIYEGLSSLPDRVKESWLAFDHFYSAAAFPEALPIVFGSRRVRTLCDVGGNTGKWALQCVAYDKDVEVTIVDLPGQIAMMEQNVQGQEGCSRIKGFGTNVLEDDSRLWPADAEKPDAIWMSQFLDCFSMEQITAILKKAAAVMGAHTRLFIMETLWDRQRFEPSAFCLTMTSLYFTALANGNSKMYDTADMKLCISRAGLEIEEIHDHLGQGHSILVCKLKQ